MEPPSSRLASAMPRTPARAVHELGRNMKRMDRFAMGRAFREIAALLELEGAQPFRARAYERGAYALDALREDLSTLIAESRLTEVAGIGEALAAQIVEMHESGRSPLLAKLREKYPPGVLELVRVPALGLSKVRALHEGLGITSLDELERACREGRVRTLKGFGAKTEARILAGIEHARTTSERLLLVEAMPIADTLLAWVREHARADLAGDLRRAQESTTTIDIVASTENPKTLKRALHGCPMFAEIEAETAHRVTARLPSGLRANVHIVAPDQHAAAMILATGPAEHVEALSARGPLRGETEESIYGSLDLAYVTPELREDPGAIARAERGPIALISADDVRGMVHCHTDWSDGRDDLLTMARAAEAIGVEYITITDHSAAAHYANGLDEERLMRQWDAIAEVQEQVSVRLLRGTECDILDDGALDWPDRILEQLDVIVASVHSQLKMDEDRMTERLIRAVRHPLFKIWGHALGRLVERRAPYAVRVPEVLDAAADARVAIEINGDPYRLDLPPPWVREARKRGIPFVISVDAHSAGALRNVRFGVAMARRGGLGPEDVLNARDADSFAAAVRPVTRRP
ncbi:MAG: helix-hairpin-helix domain-containing protein [Polyangiales bacterium]